MANSAKTSKSIAFIAKAGLIAALYVALTWISALFGLSSGAIQVRISEMLCILPIFTTAAIPGVTIGCLIANILFGQGLLDIIFGTAATLIGALLALLFKNGKLKYLASIPTIVANMIIVPIVLIVTGVGGWDQFPWFAFTVGIGEVISCGLFGGLLVLVTEKNKSFSSLLAK